MKLAEEEAVVPSLPAVDHLVGVGLIHAVVDALVRPQLAALRLGYSLGSYAPVGGDEGGDGEEEGEEVEAHRQEGPASASGLHVPSGDDAERTRLRRGAEKFMCPGPRRRASCCCFPNTAGRLRVPFGAACHSDQPSVEMSQLYHRRS